MRARRPALAIYMVSGWACEFASEDSCQRAVDGVLGKPLDLGELRTVLGRIASTHRGASTG